MSTVPTGTGDAGDGADGETRGRIDATAASVREVRSFAARTDGEVHLERRGGRTTLVVRG